MAHIFISYSRKDTTYVSALEAAIRSYGLEVWIDKRLEGGDRWIRHITEAVKECAAMIVVMSPDAEQSEWVEKEILLAERDRKRIFPLLLNGDCLPILINRQYEDVTDGKIPPETFFSALLAHLNLKKQPQLAQDVMQSDYPIIFHNASLPQIVTILLRSKSSVGAVLEDDSFRGLISIKDTLRYMANYFGKQLPDTTLATDIMIEASNLFFLEPEMPLEYVSELMAKRMLQNLPVVDKAGKLVGIVGEREVLITRIKT